MRAFLNVWLSGEQEPTHQCTVCRGIVRSLEEMISHKCAVEESMRLFDTICPRCGSMMNDDEPCGMCDYVFPVTVEECDAEDTEGDTNAGKRFDDEWETDDREYPESGDIGGEG